MAKLKNLVFYLRVKKLTISSAESVSGGYLSYLLTKTPGSSKVFRGGLIVYSPQSKNKLLRIPNQLLNKTQGVSENISILLAKRTKQFFKTDLAVSLVGFASTPAQKDIKVGTVFMAVADRKGAITKKIIIKGNRDYVRKKASISAIELICKRIATPR
ncbi:MAG: CinA family protein [Candidatus Omnitrophica bacterium]|jgi:nicotinamide-nucleotide amidase|nr:CinA family protein [Candidatus Omnitrophota bacterium]